MAKDYKVAPGTRVRLSEWDPADTDGFESKDKAHKRLAKGIETLRALQDKLYAQDRWAVLLIFQAMDAAGKDSTIAHVMSGVNPQGCQVFAFKAPSAEELDHDFLWRTTRCLPERGRIGVFNRSYYEEVLVVRVHRAILEAQRLPKRLVGRDVWQERYQSINDLEKHLARNGTLIRKFFLHVSKREQKERFLARLDEKSKNWKFAMGDVKEREHWDEYQDAYAEMISATSTKHAPWHIVPADHKWFTRMTVANIIVDALESLKLEYPKLTDDKQKELAEARGLLEK